MFISIKNHSHVNFSFNNCLRECTYFWEYTKALVPFLLPRLMVVDLQSSHLFDLSCPQNGQDRGVALRSLDTYFTFGIRFCILSSPPNQCELEKSLNSFMSQLFHMCNGNVPRNLAKAVGMSGCGHADSMERSDLRAAQ